MALREPIHRDEGVSDNNLPDDETLRFTLEMFPNSVEAEDAAGAPWGCCISPYVDMNDFDRPYTRYMEAPPVPIDVVARCEECQAYICNLSEIYARFWKCAVCGHMSRIASPARYRKSNARDTLPELSLETVDFELPLDSKGAILRSGEVMLEEGYLAKEPASSRPLVYLAVVDETGDRKFHDTMAEILDRYVESLPSDCLFGVVTISDRLGLVDLTGPVPHVQFVDLGMGLGSGLRGEGGIAGGSNGGSTAGPGGALGANAPGSNWRESMNTVSLSDVMSFQELLCPLGDRKRLSSVVRGLRKVCRGYDTQHATRQEGDTLMVGQAVKTLLDLIQEAVPGTERGNRGVGFDVSEPGTRHRGHGANGRTSPSIDRNRGFNIAGGRILVFLARAPNAGPGAVTVLGKTVTTPAESSTWVKTTDEEQEQRQQGAVSAACFRGDPKVSSFYRGQAHRATSCGLSVDVHCFANASCEHFDLASMYPLSACSGGGIFRHSLLHQRDGEERGVMLSREICVDLLRSRVYDGLLRVRTSKELRVYKDGVYGNINADPHLEDLWHVPSCVSGQAFCMDFEFQGGGMPEPAADEDVKPITVQSAFAYTAVVLDPAAGRDSLDPSDRRASSTERDRRRDRQDFVTVRRLRIRTKRTQMTSFVGFISMLSDPTAMTAILAHKVISEARQSGFAEARARLCDWLSNFIFKLSRNLPIDVEKAEADGPKKETRAIREEVLENPVVVGMAKQVFGMLHSPLLDPTGADTDERISLVSFMSSLDPESLCILLYPEMQGFADPNERVVTNLALSRESVTKSSADCRIFVIDSLWRVVIHYVDTPATLATRASDKLDPLPFPPPEDSAIGHFLALRRKLRPMAGQEVIYSRADTPEAFFFEDALLEDKPLPGTRDQAFNAFFAELTKDVLK